MNPIWFHTCSLVLHGINAILLASLLSAILRTNAKPPATTNVVLVGLTLAAFWAWHPLRVEPVAWAVDLYYILAGFFLLLSLRMLLSYFKERKVGFAIGSALLLCASLCSYPPALTWPLAIPFFWILLQHNSDGGSELSMQRLIDACRESRTVLVPSLIISMGILALTLGARFGEQSYWYLSDEASLPVYTRALYAAYSFSGLLGRMLLPLNLTPAWQPEVPGIWQFIPFALLCLTCAYLLIDRRRNCRRSLAWLTMLGLTALPTLGLTEGNYFQPDRFTYCLSIFSLAGIAALLSHTKLIEAGSTALRPILLILLAALLCIPLSRLNLQKWENSYSLFAHLDSVSWVQESTHLSRQVDFIRARKLRSDHRYAEAEAIFEELLPLTNNTFVWREAALNKALSGQIEEAIRMLYGLDSQDEQAGRLLSQLKALIPKTEDRTEGAQELPDQ